MSAAMRLEPGLSVARRLVSAGHVEPLKFPAARVPTLAHAACMVRDGALSSGEFSKLVQAIKPVEPYQELPAVTPLSAVKDALDRNKIEKAWCLAEGAVKADTVCARLDIPAFTRKGAWAICVHEGKGTKAGRVLSYESWLALEQVEFLTHERAALKIACGGYKAPMASIRGAFHSMSCATIRRRATAAMQDRSWVQVGFDPERHAYFYTRDDQRPVLSAAQVLQVGPLVLAQHPVFGDRGDFLF